MVEIFLKTIHYQADRCMRSPHIKLWAIMRLIRKLYGASCQRPSCGTPLRYKQTYVGTCLLVSWKCDAGNIGGSWAAQPFVECVRAGNLLLASALLLSENSMQKQAWCLNFATCSFSRKTCHPISKFIDCPNSEQLLGKSLEAVVGGNKGRESDFKWRCKKWFTQTLSTILYIYFGWHEQ